jgi:heat shock protein HslJ
MIIMPVVIGCQTAAPTPSLDGREFLSVEVTEGGSKRELVPGTRIGISFTDGRVGLAAGCNSIGGSYRLEDGRLVVGELSMTAIGCDAARHAQDDWLSRLVASRPLVTLDGSDLTLQAADTRLEMVDREVAEPDASLTGTRWIVETLITGEVASSIPAGVEASVELAPDGEVSVNTGCNEGGGRYAVEGDELRISELVLTRRGCLGPAGSVEEAVLAVLESDNVRHQIRGSVLTLDAGDHGLVLRTAQPTL